MSREAMWASVRMAWAMLSGRTMGEVVPGRPRESPTPRPGDEPATAKGGFDEEAVPWLDAVYRFALRLTRGSEDAAQDLVQETYLRAYRFWDTYERGSNAKSWLFTICRNAYLQGERRNRERPVSDHEVDPITGALAYESAFGTVPQDPESDFFAGLIDEEVVEAIDGLSEEFREVLVLSDLGDLKYTEIAEVLGLPIGTVRSRLFRARRQLQERLRDFAARAGYVRRTTHS